jgi:hypothetical protein
MLYHEQLRLGWFLIPEILALLLITIGYIEIAKSPVATAHDESEPSPPVEAADAAPPAQAATDPATDPAIGPATATDPAGPAAGQARTPRD